ncbi:CCA1, partial [Symbiodinium sp. KB8]
MTGAGVAGVVHDHLVAAGEAATRVAVIQANPEQSKHLETATTKVHGKEVDFVNLRCEEYAEDSRIPTTKFGSPLDDALRRDFTVNAMFYNVNDGVIEDYTGRGFVDLKAGVIRTPLEPRTTLLDDPLRALRAVRFASRYAFTVVPELLACMASVEVRQALEDKVSRERVGSEVEGMLLSDRPIGALRMLRQVGLLSTVLTPPRLASRSELEEHITATSKKHRRGGKPSSAQQALLAYPYAPGAGGDASGEAGEGPCPEALLGAGAEVV